MVGHGHQRFIAQRLHPFRVFVEDLTGRSQLHRLARAVKQAVAVLLLQLANLRAHRRLRAENLFPRARKTALPSHFQERDELIEVHFVGTSLLSKIIAEPSHCKVNNWETSAL